MNNVNVVNEIYHSQHPKHIIQSLIQNEGKLL